MSALKWSFPVQLPEKCTIFRKRETIRIAGFNVFPWHQLQNQYIPYVLKSQWLEWTRACSVNRNSSQVQCFMKVSSKTRRVSKVNRGGSCKNSQEVGFEVFLVLQIGINLFAQLERPSVRGVSPLLFQTFHITGRRGVTTNFSLLKLYRTLWPNITNIPLHTELHTEGLKYF